MDFLHLTDGPNGESRFSDAAIELTDSDFAPPAPTMLSSQPETCTNLRYLILPVGWGGAQHRSPRRQVAFCLSGRLRVEAGDGEVREFGAGAIWRMEDVSGDGHTTTVVGDDDVKLAIVQF